MEDTTRRPRRKVGLTHETVVDTALKLSQECGIDGWSMRQIATQLGVVQSVLYHYFPNKDSLCDAVMERIGAEVHLPDPALEWKQWFFQMLRDLRPSLLRYGGVTDRLARGGFTKSWLPIIDIGCEKLIEAGFGEKASIAHTIIMNSAIHAVGAHNLRAPHQQEERHNLDEMLGRFESMMSTSPGLQLMVTSYLAPLSNPELEEKMSEEYFDLAISCVLEGVDRTLRQ
ncbi:TetR family transcriptional regulator [Staphylococcus chromogenes]|nr:TetR family transcriptional regulator [Staphylococcus chromogenes]